MVVLHNTIFIGVTKKYIDLHTILIDICLNLDFEFSPSQLPLLLMKVLCKNFPPTWATEIKAKSRTKNTEMSFILIGMKNIFSFRLLQTCDQRSLDNFCQSPNLIVCKESEIFPFLAKSNQMWGKVTGWEILLLDCNHCWRSVNMIIFYQILGKLRNTGKTGNISKY